MDRMIHTALNSLKMILQNQQITSQNISYFSKENVMKFCQSELGKTSLSFSDSLPKEATFSVFRS